MLASQEIAHEAKHLGQRELQARAACAGDFKPQCAGGASAPILPRQQHAPARMEPRLTLPAASGTGSTYCYHQLL